MLKTYLKETNEQIYVQYLEFHNQYKSQQMMFWVQSAIPSLYALSALEQTFLECLDEQGAVRAAWEAPVISRTAAIMASSSFPLSWSSPPSV